MKGTPANETDNLYGVVLIITLESLIKSSGIFTKKICTGTVIREDLVLTAAHCFSDGNGARLPDMIRVRIGLGYGDAAKDRFVPIQLSDVHISPTYIFKIKNDLAILRSRKQLLYKKSQIMWLPSGPFSAGKECQIAGFGEKLVQDKMSSITLSKMSVDVINANRCLYQAFFSMFGMQVICFRFYDSGPCLGDSGGPLICNHTVYGVLSRGFVDANVCDAAHSTVLYEDVFAQMDWILSVMNSTPISYSGCIGLQSVFPSASFVLCLFLILYSL